MVKTWRTKRRFKPDFNKTDIQPYPATKFFDQLSFIGDEIVGCFVLETQKGYILIDCMNPDERCKNIIEQGFKDLGFDINDLYAILITHGHGDHFGNAGYFKEKYNAEIYMSEIDYNLASNLPDHFPWDSVDFKVDYYFKDNETLQFGDTKILTTFTPGHSIGCYSFIFNVTDEGRPHNIALWGGSGILGDSNVDDYYNSLVKFSKLSDEYNVTGVISTHPILDMGLMRLDIIRNITDGIPNPFVIGRDGCKYYEKQFYDMAEEAKKKNKA